MMHFSVLVTGWECDSLVNPCWQSLASQEVGDFTWSALFYDDGSSDGTWREISSLLDDVRLQSWRGTENMGATFSRKFLLDHVYDPDTVCVLLDMDDQLESYALARVFREYVANPETMLTYGSWKANTREALGQEIAQGEYSERVIATRSYRQSTFKASPLRTFRRRLADNIPDRYLQDSSGKWLKCCTDVALMWCLLERCRPEQVRHIPEMIYKYTWRRPTGTVNRFGFAEKIATRNYLATLQPLDAPIPV